MNKIVDEQFRGNQLTNIFEIIVGSKVLWELQSTNRSRHPYCKGDLIEATILANPWVNGKVRIKASIGLITTVKVTSLFEDKRRAYEQQKKASQFDQACIYQG